MDACEFAAKRDVCRLERGSARVAPTGRHQSRTGAGCWVHAPPAAQPCPAVAGLCGTLRAAAPPQLLDLLDAHPPPGRRSDLPRHGDHTGGAEWSPRPGHTHRSAGEVAQEPSMPHASSLPQCAPQWSTHETPEADGSGTRAYVSRVHGLAHPSRSMVSASRACAAMTAVRRSPASRRVLRVGTSSERPRRRVTRTQP